MKNKINIRRTYKMTLAGILSAQALVLAYIESLIPLTGMPPGIKIGLSNIIVMYTLGTLGPVPAFFIVIVKAGFAGLTRGIMSLILSFAGGVASILAMSVLSEFGKEKFGFFGISITGAVFHNLSQLLIISFITYSKAFIVYSPVLIISGIIMGVVTGIILKLITPMLKKQGLFYIKQ